jgi:hypothetical protein
MKKEEIVEKIIEAAVFTFVAGLFTGAIPCIKKIMKTFKGRRFEKINISKKRLKRLKKIKRLLKIKHKILMIRIDDKKEESRTAYCPKCGGIPSKEEVADSGIFDKGHISYECKKCDKKYKMSIKTGEIKTVGSFGHDFRK